MFGWLKRNRRPSLTNTALKLEKVFAMKVIAAFHAGESDMSKEQIGALVHGDAGLAYLSEYVIAACNEFGLRSADDMRVATAMVLDNALHYPKDEIIPAIMRTRALVLDAIEEFSAIEGAAELSDLGAMPPDKLTILAAAWGGKENGKRYAEDVLNGSEEVTAKELAEFSAIVLGRASLSSLGQEPQ